MDIRVVLSKVITLIYKSRLLGTTDYDNLIRTILDTIKVDSPEFNFLGNNSIKSFKEMCLSLLNEKDIIPKEVLIPQISIILENDTKLLNVIKDSIEQDQEESSNKRIVTNLVKNLNNYYREQLAIDIISKVSYDLKFNRNKITNFSDYLQNTISQLEPLATSITTFKDPAIVNELDFENPESVDTIFDAVKAMNNDSGVYKFGWQALNRMLQGGIRRGEFQIYPALEHRFKTGFTLSCFIEVARQNVPQLTKDEIEGNKKPLLLRISFEDSLTNNLQFMYQYLKAMEGNPIATRDFVSIPSSEMTEYILKEMTKTGFHIKMLRVDPSQWSYMSVINKIIELEAQGYSVHLLMLDYITLLPTTGCTQGPIGSDKRDLIRRMRNFTSARNIAFISPLQLGPEVKQMLRNGVPEHQIVKDIVGKSLLDGSKSISQEVDTIVYLHLFTHRRKKFLSVALDKHRLPSVVGEEDRYFILPFPGLNIPILGDLDKEDSSLQKLPKGDYEDGSGNLLNEVLG